MTAGTAASATGTVTNHHVDPTLNYTPRPLSRGQRSRREVFVYQSPRNQRVVTVSDAAIFALALKLEFDPKVRGYVERPRQLQLTPKTRIDLSFWSQTTSGDQQFHLLIPATRTAHGTTGTVTLPSQEELIDIGDPNGVLLTCLSESELLSSLPQVAIAFELLPLVWASERIAKRASIAAQVKELLGRAERINLASVGGAIPHSEHQIRATVAWMIHQGAAKLVDYAPGANDAVLEACHD